MTDRNTTTPPGTSRRNGMFWEYLLMLPPLTLLGSLLIWSAVEYRSSLVIATTIETRKATGKPTNHAEMTQAVFDRSNQEGSLQWTQLLRQSEVLRGLMMQKKLINVEQFLNSPDVTDVAALESVLIRGDSVLVHAQPIFLAIDELGTMSPPIWLPMASERFRYGWFAVGHVCKIVELDILIALKKQERQRIIRGMERLLVVERLYIDSFFGASFLHAQSRLTSRYTLLAKCLAIPGWTSEELESLERLAQTEMDLSKLWQDDIEHWIVGALETNLEDAWYISDQTSEPWQQNIRMTPSWQAELITSFEQIQKISFADPSRALNDMTEYAKRYEGRLPTSIEYAATNFSGSLSLRSLVLTGLAIRRFKLANQRWPRNWSELIGTYITEADIRLPNGLTVGFEPQEFGPEIWLPRNPKQQVELRSNETRAAAPTRSAATPIRD